MLVSGATTTVKALSPHPHLGVLLTPIAANRPPVLGECIWAADNSAFSGFRASAFVRMLEGIQGRADCRWVAVPDVIGDWEATRAQYAVWEPVVRWFGLRVAVVLQNGAGAATVPWDADAVFVGGDTPWKLGREARELVAEAKRRGRLAHMGRVNSLRRLRYARDIGCDSVDGTKYSRFPETHLPRALRFLESERRQGVLW